ncbi:alpha/beta hydrolase [Sulfitobacter sp. 20_GPM-1509m]|uniref:alpha/beta hydrolase n=1 Tax=Sulfitobacter sp. 20_GPM-1509m TaxID=1380367 RepID=UPI000684CC85|nr:alpha/beta fold hydrolase [Sulfitobacter sp. 20_GPM-1509m]
MLRFLIISVFLLSACADRVASPVVPAALDIGTIRSVFVGTTRAEYPPGTFSIGRSPNLSLLQVKVSIPPDHKFGEISDGQNNPDPERDFVLAQRNNFATPDAFRNALNIEIEKKNAPGRDVTVFVHGFNNSFADGVFRVAQMANDLKLPGSFVSYAWPSRGNPLGYQYDSDSALFARDGLQELLYNVQGAGTDQIVLVAHSMGGALLMETLRQIEIARPGWTSEHIAGVVLMSPDLNVDVFRSQVRSFKKLPQPFLIFVSKRDIVLKLSARMRGEASQLGNISSAADLDDMPVQVIDVSAFQDRRSGDHFVAAGSPALGALLSNLAKLDDGFVRGRSGGGISLPGTRRVYGDATELTVRAPVARDR